MSITASYLFDNGYIEDVYISELEDGTPFAIVEEWDDVYEVNYAVIKELIPEVLPLYEEAGLIKKRRWGDNMILEEIKINGEVPQNVLEVLEQNEIKYYDIMESALGCEWGFSDEYTACSDCGNVIRTEPDSYHWQPDYYVSDGFIVCNTCFNDEEESYQEAYIEERVNQPTRAVNGLMTEEQIEALGFDKLDDEYQNGWYDRNDNPEQIYDALSDRFYEVLFFIDGVGQFHVDYSVFVRGEIERKDD